MESYKCSVKTTKVRKRATKEHSAKTTSETIARRVDVKATTAAATSNVGGVDAPAKRSHVRADPRKRLPRSSDSVVLFRRGWARCPRSLTPLMSISRGAAGSLSTVLLQVPEPASRVK